MIWFMNLVNVVKGFCNWIFGITIQAAEKRKEICNGCEFKQRSTFIDKDICGICSCYLDAKQTIENETCPLGKW